MTVPALTDQYLAVLLLPLLLLVQVLMKLSARYCPMIRAIIQ
jgi:hypothetical protein